MLDATILLVEGDEDLLELMRTILLTEGYRVYCTSTAEEAFASLETVRPDLVILESMLSGIHGPEICRYVKGTPSTANIPIILVSSDAEASDEIAGLDSGADDYLTKPFNIGVLLARIRAALRSRDNNAAFETSLIEIGDVTIDSVRHQVFHRGELVILTADQFSILRYLAARQGLVCRRNEIIRAVKGEDSKVTDRSVDVQIVALRKKFGEAGEMIETVRGVGYRIRSQRDSQMP